MVYVSIPDIGEGFCMSKLIDLTGQKFGRLTVLKQASRRPQSNTIYWECRCDCGVVRVVAGQKLREGKTKSCGCLARELTSARVKIHGGVGTRLYRIWCGVKERCANQNHRDYQYYGGKGISVCDEWLNFKNFQEWAMANGYDKNADYMECTIDRKDYSGNYCPENCRFVNMLIQNRNKPARVDNQSGTKGVYWDKRNGRWTADIGVNYNRIRLGHYDNKADAIRARKIAELRYWGQNASA